MLNEKGTIEIKTERLLLRKYRLTDAEDILKNYAMDPRVTKFLSWEPYKNIEDLNDFISEQILNYDNSIYNWVIVFENQVIGSISAIAMDKENRICEIGYCLGYEFWNKGIMTEAVIAILNYLFNEIGFEKIMAKHDIENNASGRVMEKSYMLYEGKLKGYYLQKDGIYSDAKLYGVSKGYFNRNRKNRRK